jgi:riboflavin synthase
MFTGIVQKVAPITRLEKAGESLRVRVSSGFTDLEPGESIAVNGVCLTVTEYDSAGNALFFVSPETLDKSNLGGLVEGARVNLERAVTLNTRLSGHLVQGHVDGLGKLVAVQAENANAGGGSYAMKFEIPMRLARYCVEKGSIALNGVSLTINRLERVPSGDACLVSITLIPHTWDHTQFSGARVGDPVNVEVDVLAKYVENLSLPYAPRGAP